MRCSADFIKHKLFPNVKEVTESFGAFEAVVKLGLDFNDPSINIVCVADGSTPRTAATFAFRTKWTCYSIDPQLSNRPWNQMISRLTAMKTKVEDWHFDTSDKVVLVAVHSHVALSAAIKSIVTPQLAVVAIPCCLPQYVPGVPHSAEYNDKHMWSPKNLVKTWTFRHSQNYFPKEK